MNKRLLATIAFSIALFDCLCGQEPRSGDTNPYVVIAQRNLFGLLTPKLDIDNPPPSATSPPQITVCGTMFIFDRTQVLFKVAGIPQPGQTVSESSHILAIGEAEAGIKVINIDPANETITFNNHGLVQTISLGLPTAAWKPPIPEANISGPIPLIWGTDHLRRQT